MPKDKVMSGCDTPRWTRDGPSRSVPLSGLPADLRETLKPSGRGPQKTPTKVKVSIRLSQDVVLALRLTGTGWQSRVDDALRAMVKLQGKKA